MSHVIHLSDERYQAIAALAAKQKKNPEEYIDNLLAEKAREEAEYALIDAAFANDPEWIAGALEAREQVARGEGTVYQTTEEFFAALDAVPYVAKEKTDANV